MPERVKVQGDYFHGRVPEGAYYAGRAAPGLKQSPLHNPYPVKVHGLDQSLALYRAHLLSRPDLLELASMVIRFAGQDMACWCDLDRPCHVDVLLKALGGEAPGTAA
jgi:hypothetical protein